MPFPPLQWWAAVLQAGECLLDAGEHFEKGSYRSRYHVAAANGTVLLSIPLQGGRRQRVAMKDALIDNRPQWQQQQWRTIYSGYGRAPFFEHYGLQLEALLLAPYERLVDFNHATIRFAADALRVGTVFKETESFQLHYPEGVLDLRPERFAGEVVTLPYYQVFADRYGFTPNLSILDLLLNEGPSGIGLLRP